MVLHYYIEEDGRVFVLSRSGSLHFPTSKKQVPFNFRITGKMTFIDIDVFFCQPILDKFPSEWPLKDDLLLNPKTDAIVKRSIAYSYVRHVCHAVIPDKGRILVVKANRGYTKGIWNLPGGFIRYGEPPEHAVVRESLEETGYNIKAQKLIGVYTQSFRHGFYMISLAYLCKIVSGKDNPDRTEIDRIAFMDPQQAIRKTNSPFVKAAIRDYLRAR